MAASAESSSVRSAERALDILIFLASKARPVPAAAIARSCGLPRSSAYHLLNVMMKRDFISHYPQDRTWGLGVAAFEIGTAYLRSGQLERLSRPLLAELVEQTGQTAHLGTLHGSDVLYLAKHQPAHRKVPLVTEVGVRLPAHLTAVGKAILMHQSTAQIRAMYPQPQALINRTGRGPVYLRELLSELSEQRERGYAQEDSQTTVGISCLGAPVFRQDGFVDAALGLTFSSAHFVGAAREHLAEELVAGARQLSALLGFTPTHSGVDSGRLTSAAAG